MTLLINADDTLWESNVFFEKTLERFFSLVEPFGYARAYARHILNETERLNIRQHGYGVRSFGRTLEQSYAKLAGGLAQRSALEHVNAMVAELESTPPRVLE
jgi:putative hydrolase of the HAD superfamily